MEETERTQFVYKREINIPPVKEDVENGVIGIDGYTKVVFDSFNINNIIRSITMDDGRVLVLLDDLHEREERRPKFNPKTGKPSINKQGQIILEVVRDTFQSEIFLSEEEGKEFLKLTSINSYE